jgi:alkaline phosphatase
VGKVPGATYYNHFYLYGPAFYWHTNALVPVFAKGAGASSLNTQPYGLDPIRGKYIDNTSIFQVVSQAIK